MKIAFCADVHIGNHKICGGPYSLTMNDRCRATLAVLESAAWSVSVESCDQLVVLGDLFDTECPTPQMIAATAEALSGVMSHTLVGNHDQVSSREGDHALGWMRHSRNQGIHEKPEMFFDGENSQNAVLMVPFQVGDPTEWLLREVAQLVQRCAPDAIYKTRTLCIHLGLRDKEARKNPWAAKAIDAVDIEWLAELCSRHGITHVFAGNWHHAGDWTIDGVRMVQCGALVPTGWDNPGLEGYGGLVFFDTRTAEVTRHEVPGPRFVEIESTLDLMAQTEAAKALGHKLYVRSTCPPSMVSTITAVLEEATDLAGWDVVPDLTAEREGAERASRAARDQSTLVEALDSFVAELELAEGVARSAVLQRCAGFLGLQGDVSA